MIYKIKHCSILLKKKKYKIKKPKPIEINNSNNR